MMKKFMYVLLAAILVGSTMTLSAQNKEAQTKKPRPTQEQIIEMQGNQMVKVLMLDDATAAKFLPVYTRYLTALRECRTMNRHARIGNTENQGEQANQGKPAMKPALTDAEIEKQIKDQFAQSRKILDTREKYYNEFRKLLSPKQIAKIYQTERGNADKFKKEFNQRKNASHARRNNHKRTN
ncbi:hypothetical protein [Bacteroides neonati]|uniref:hypothetical protein n=1 Tax=Bacteroides neonati TaxID=1347393 RepID=UPI0011DD47CD|nr:hypothetical protein [Bacteroides neonati]